MANVLTVGFERDQSEIFRLLLFLHRSHETDHASNAREALDAARRRPPDVIVIDPRLPDERGSALCESLKSHRNTCQIPVVIIMAWGDFDSPEQYTRSGSNARVYAPYSPDEFLAAVDEALSWAQSLPARRGAGQIVFDTRDEDGWLQQTNDMNVDVLTLTTLPEGEAVELKRVVLEAGDTLRAWGRENRCGRAASLCWKVERERIHLEVSRDGLRERSPDDPLTRFLDALFWRCGFVPPAGSPTGEPVVLEKVVPV
jgi:DNA-binding response OmpR family regulator